jgi:hypothetical protein
MTSSGTTGGSVVSSVPASVATAAGQYGVNAANEASSLAAQSIGAAIQATNAQYQTATAALQPYTQEGVQALDKLNSYIGLSAYDPGAAPTAPTAPTLASLAAGISQSDINSYIQSNSTANFNSSGQFFGNYAYTGAGADSLYSGLIDPNSGDTGAGLHATSLANLESNTDLQNAVRNSLAQDQLNDPNSYANLLYGIQKTAYDTNSTQWQYADTLKQQYDASGPMTANDITNTITNQPGYQSQLSQGIGAINSDAAAKGYLGSGMMLKELNQFGQNTLSQYYGNTLSQLASLAGAGQQAATSTAATATSTGNSLSALLTSLGQDQANAALSAGNSQSQAAILAGTQYSTVGGSSSSSLSGIGSILGSLSSLGLKL